MKIKTIKSVAVIFFLVVAAYAVLAAPTGPGTVTKLTNERRVTALDNDTTGTVIQAQAGNLTSLNVTSRRLTVRWQGYYGNITATITLDDASNNTIYSWDLASPQGEIYASNGSIVTWGSVFCFNYTNNLSNTTIVQKFNGTDLERMIGASGSEKESVNSTFNGTFTGTFQVGSITINTASSCMKTNLYVSDAQQFVDFDEVLLTDNDSIIFTSIIEQSATGFQGSPVDFQMLVGENGDVTAASNYYFFVELS